MDRDIGYLTLAKSEQIRKMLLVALSAARFGVVPEQQLIRALVSGDRALTLDQLEFDSLAWMEFCISIEDQSGQELTPEQIVGMRYFFEIEEWLHARV